MNLSYLWRSTVLIAVGLLIYAQSFHFGFVFDDFIFIVNNPFIKNFNNIHLIWKAFPMTRFVGMYSFALNYYVNQLNPAGYHIFNFIVHLISTFLVWALAELLFKITKTPSKGLPFFIAILFLVHPGQTQAVTYITQRFESMATMIYLAAIYVYLQGRLARDLRGKALFFGLTGILAVIGIMTKEVTVTIPAMILAAEWIFFPSKDKRVYFFLLGGGVLLYLLFSKMVLTQLNVFLQTIPSESHDGDILTGWTYVLTQMRVFLTFLRLLVWPSHQNLDYDYPASTGMLTPPLTLVGIAVIVGFMVSIIKLRRQKPLIAFGLSWMLITFSINLVPRANVIFEHKLYLISFGFFLAAVAALNEFITDYRILIKVICCITVIFGVVSFERNKVWADELTLWQESIKFSPNKSRVNGSLGRMYGSRGQYDQAIYYLSRSIAIHPDNIAYENRGIIYEQEGKTEQALDDLTHAIAMDPKYFSSYVKRAWVYQVQHQYLQALADLNIAIQLEPYFVDAYLERGMLWMQMGHKQDAFNDFQQVLKLDPFNQTAHQQLNNLAGMGLG